MVQKCLCKEQPSPTRLEVNLQPPPLLCLPLVRRPEPHLPSTTESCWRAWWRRSELMMMIIIIIIIIYTYTCDATKILSTSARGYSKGCVEQLVADLQLDTVRPEALQWLLQQLPSLTPTAPGRLVRPESTEVRQLFDEELPGIDLGTWGWKGIGGKMRPTSRLLAISMEYLCYYFFFRWSLTCG